ncbi:hypothetical protein [Geodermatophilus sp. CPCC 205506]|uniref:hypothetical protein n=1 Tax=Geodermatophilus sp. CPCC 205506 TaxID=2936596 RepID=UPI003EEE99C9
MDRSPSAGVAPGERPAGGTPPEPTYQHALEVALALGRADGRLAVDVEPDGEPAAAGPVCHGLDPEEFAGLVWGAGAGTAPTGVLLNAPLWYAHGFREALATARAQRGSSPHPTPPGVGPGPTTERQEIPMTMPSTSAGRRDSDPRGTRPVIPVPRPPADDDVPEEATPTEQWVTYPGVHYALERIAALRRADTAPDRVHRA